MDFECPYCGETDLIDGHELADHISEQHEVYDGILQGRLILDA